MRLLRCVLVTMLATVAAASALRLLVPSVPVRDPGFEAILVSGCAGLACACSVWGWLSVVAVVGEALCGAGRPTGPPGVPPGLRRAVLAACGVALTATATPALAANGADTGQALPAALARLPFPARAMDLPAQTQHVVVVRPGDSLWAITDEHLAADASDAEITRGWQALYAHNRAVVGDDPSLIHPGQRLILPDDLEEPS